jgi:DNA-binding CsgD family transcriptional regulator
MSIFYLIYFYYCLTILLQQTKPNHLTSMRFQSNVDLTYMGCLHNVWYANDQAEEQEIYSLLEKFKQFSLSGLALLPAFFVLDYTKRNYFVLTDSAKNILTYDTSAIKAGGSELTLDVVLKDHFNTVNTKVFSATIQFLQNVPRQQQQDYVFSYSSQFEDSKGNWVRILQKNVYITSIKTGLPLYCITMMMDITAYKRDNTIVHTIEKISREANSIELIETNCFYLNEEDALLTKQEKNIVKWMADGLSTKMIADKLCLSENTITAHRKNMLRKTNTKNVAQLIAFVIRNSII